MESNNQRIIFTIPEETTILEVIFQILEDNELKESVKEAFDKSIKGEDSRFIIIRDAALTIARKMVPEEELIKLLSDHLKISQEKAKKVILNIKEKIIPYAKEVSDKTNEEENMLKSTQEIILEKIRNNPNQNQVIPIPEKSEEKKS